MIAYNLAVAFKKGFLKDEKYRDASVLAASELKKYATEDIRLRSVFLVK